jgi:hypothetical protein
MGHFFLYVAGALLANLANDDPAIFTVPLWLVGGIIWLVEVRRHDFPQRARARGATYTRDFAGDK